jgi:heterotetrameric sarcosine oxidase delta subunit
MRIHCPHCGERDVQEFSYLGDATLVRPDGMSAEQDAFYDYVYLRDNPAGPHREYWYHASGCHAWLVVTRNTITHAITSAEPAREVTLSRQNGAAS